MLAIVNGRSAGGRGTARWKNLEAELRLRLGPFEAREPRSLESLDAIVAGALGRGERHFLAAGGDGTVNAVVAALLRATPRSGDADGKAAATGSAVSPIVLGAAGLGSSNDFHKPYRRVMGGVPCRIDFDGARAADVGQVEWLDPHGLRHQAFWVVNASIGTTAAANWAFNHPGPALGLLKRTSTATAIAWAATGAILGHGPETLSLELDGWLLGSGRFRNLGVVKNPHFTGSLHYDSPDEPGSGRFFVHGLRDVPLPRLLSILAGLSQGRFRGRPGTWSLPGHVLWIRSATGPFPLEYDGEVVQAVEARFTLMPRRLLVCP